MNSTVLVVDDDRLIREMLRDLLNEAGFEVIQAENGVEGCRIAHERMPDVILIDLFMPVMDGLEACRELRSNPSLKFTPIIMLTARTDLQETVNPFQVGADDYLSKPFDGFELVSRVHGNLLKKRAIEALIQKARDYEAIIDITDSVNSSLETVEILRQIVNRIANLIDDVYRCSIAVIQEDEQYGYILASSDDPDISSLKINLSKYPEIRQVIRTNKPLRIDDINQDPLLDEVRPSLQGQKFNAILVLPIPYRGKVIGAMVVRVARSKAGISQEEMEFCQLVANVSANALKNARYFEVLREESEILRSAKGKLEDELRIKAIYEEIFEKSSEGLVAFNEKGEVVFFNRMAMELIGYSSDQLLGTNFKTVLDNDTVRTILKRHGKKKKEKVVPPLFDVNITTGNNERRIISVSFSGNPVREGLWVASFRDVTEKREMENDLVRTRANLERANERLVKLDSARADFLNTATHELRIPVSIVHGYCSLMHDMGTDNLSPQQREFLDEAIKSSERLVDLINNMLDLSRLDAGKSHVDLQQRDVGDLLMSVCNELKSMAANKGLDLLVDEKSKGVAFYDEEKIQRVLFNLVGNAIKFTEAGGKIFLSLKEREGDVLVIVEDTGKGIPKDRIPELFNEFTQVGKDDSRRGTGLGLSICKKIVESHQGEIWAESTPGEGSRFMFTLLKLP